MKINFKGLMVALLSSMAISFSVYADQDVKIELKEMPARAQEFLAAFFTNMPIQAVVTDEARSEFEVLYPMGLEVEFDKNGNWSKVEYNMKRMMTEMQEMRKNWQQRYGQAPQNGQGAQNANADDKKAQKERRKNRQNGDAQQGQRPQGQWQRPQGQPGQGMERGQMGQGQRPMGARPGMGQGQPARFKMETLLNDAIKSYIKENYPNPYMMITVIERYSNGYKVTIATGRDTTSDLIFALNGKFISKTDNVIERPQMGK